MKKNLALIFFAIFTFTSLFLSIFGAVLNMKIIILIGVIGMSVGVLMVPLRGLIKPFACAMGWHSYKYDIISFDGASEHARCQWCKYEGMIDSQGNLF